MKSFKLTAVTITYALDAYTYYAVGNRDVVKLDKLPDARGVRVTWKNGSYTGYYAPWIDFLYTESKSK